MYAHTFTLEISNWNNVCYKINCLSLSHLFVWIQHNKIKIIIFLFNEYSCYYSPKVQCIFFCASSFIISRKREAKTGDFIHCVFFIDSCVLLYCHLKVLDFNHLTCIRSKCRIKVNSSMRQIGAEVIVLFYSSTFFYLNFHSYPWI